MAQNKNYQGVIAIVPPYEYCEIEDKTFKVIEEYLQKLKLSNRAYSKILKVARTIADLDKENNIKLNHVLEAIQYRILDR